MPQLFGGSPKAENCGIRTSLAYGSEPIWPPQREPLDKSLCLRELF